MPDTFIKYPNQNTVNERSSFSTTAYFRDANNAADAPATVHYRIDDLVSQTAIVDWTSLSAAASVTITVKSSENRMISNGNRRERRQLTVAADKGTDGETRDVLEWYVKNIRGFDE